MKNEEIIRSIIAILVSDGTVGLEERLFLDKISKNFNISNTRVTEIFEQVKKGQASISLPTNPDEQKELFTMLVQAACSDRVIEPKEQHILDAVAAKFGILPNDIQHIIETTFQSMRLKAEQTTTENILTIPSANFGIRFAAGMIDFILLLIFRGIIYPIYIIETQKMGIPFSVEQKEHIALVLLSMSALVYYVITETYPFQTSIGKRLFLVKITDSSGQPLSFIRALIRSMIKSIYFIHPGLLLSVYVLSVITLAVSKKEQFFHDWLVKSVVIQYGKFSDYNVAGIWYALKRVGVATLCWIVLVIVLFIQFPSFSETAYWLRASYMNRSQDYAWYFKNFPDSRYAQKAEESYYAIIEEKQRFDERQKWDNAHATNTIQGYKEYIELYPQGQYLSEAYENAEQLVWQQTIESNSIVAYQNYLIEYPDGRLANEAKNKIEQLSWQYATTENTVTAYK